MDKKLQLLKRYVIAYPTDVKGLQNYIRALERTRDGGEPSDDHTFKVFLLSGHGARHEDRIPEAIFSTEQAARDYVQNYANNYYTGDDPVEIHESDSGYCIEFWDMIGNAGGEIGFILDSFELDSSPKEVDLNV